jgi:hypothetical protein
MDKYIVTISHYMAGDGYYAQTYSVNDERTHYWDTSYQTWVKIPSNATIKQIKP